MEMKLKGVKPCLIQTILSVAVACTCYLPIGTAFAQSAPSTSQARLYYHIGGSDPAAHAANTKVLSLKLNLSGVVRFNYSCGKFDAGISFANLMNSFKQLGSTVEGAVKAGIAALPMYILQRAQPGLYELYQTYSKQAQVTIAASLKTCEDMEAQIRSGQDPYENFLKQAKSESWKNEANSGQDVVQSKTNVETANGRDGLTWIGGVKAGGASQNPINIIKDLTSAGFNTTMGVGPLNSATTSFPSTGSAATNLAKNFATPAAAAQFATDVLGDAQIATCSDTNCPTKGSTTGLGLLPKLELEQAPALAQMNALLVNSTPTFDNLNSASAPGVAISRELVSAIKEMPPGEQSIAVNRLSREVAMARTIDKALTVRNLILTGLTLPETNMPAAATEARRRIEELNHYIDDLMFESRVRKEMVSNTASAVLDSYYTRRAGATALGTQATTDPTQLTNGRVK